MAQYDGSIRIDTSIITKNIRPKVQEIVKSLEEIGKEAEKAREKLDFLDKAGVSHASEEYKAAQAELQKYVDSYKDSMYKIAEYGHGVSDSLQFDTSKIDAAREKLQSLEDSGIDHSSKEYKEAERDLNHVIDAYEQYQEVIDEFDSYTRNAFSGFKILKEETEEYLSSTNEDISESLGYWNELRGNVEEYAKALKELHDQGKFFGDEDYNEVYLAWKNATDAVKAYQAELNKQTESGQAKIAEQAAKAAAKQAAEQEKIAEKEAKAAEKKEAAQRRAEEQAEKALQRENARIQKEIENQAKLEAKEAERKAKEEARIAAIQAKEEAKRAKEVAAIQEQEAEEQRLAEIRENAVVGNQKIIETVGRIKELEQEIADLKAAGITEGYEDYGSRIQELKQLKQEVRDYSNSTDKMKESYKGLGGLMKWTFSTIAKGFRDIPIAALKASIKGIRTLITKTMVLPFKAFGNVAKKAISSTIPLLKRAASSMLGFGKSAQKSNSTLGSFGSRFKSLALSAIIFNQIGKAFNAMISGMKEGFGNLYNEVGGFKSTVDGLKASTLTLKNSFAAAFRPLVEIAIPYVQRTIDAIANLMNIIGQFTAAITGQKTYTKAIKQTTAAIEDENKAQNKQLSGLDKLNNLSSGSGGASGGGGAENMFEENVPIESGILGIFQNIKDLIESEDWEGLGAYIAGALNQGLQKIYDVINWDNVGPYITYFVTAFTGAFNGLVDNLDWDLLGRTIGAGINTIVNSLTLLISGIDWVALGTGLAAGLNGLANEVDFTNVGNLIGLKFMVLPSILLGFVTNLDWAAIGTQIGNALNGVVSAIDLSQIGELLGKGLTGIFQMAISFAATFDWEALGTNIFQGINSFFENTDWAVVGQGLSDFAIGLLDAAIVAIEGVDWQQVGESLKTLLVNIDWTGLAERLAEGIGAVLGGLAALLWGLIEDAWNSVVEWWNEVAFEDGEFTILGLLDGIWEGIKNIGTWIYEHIFEPFIEGFKSAFGIHSPSTVMAELGGFLMEGLLSGIQSLVDAVTEIWEFMKEIAISLWERIKEKISTIVNGIKSVVTAVINTIKTVWTTVWNAVKTVALNIWNGIKTTISTVINGIKTGITTALNAIKAIWNRIWTGLKTTVTNIFNGIWSTIKGVINSILGGIENMANGVINGVNAVINALNGIGFDMPDWLGGESFRLNIPTLSNVSIPRLATGTVVPPNNEFLAVLGDNKREPEVVSPLSTIEQAVENAMRRNGGMGGGEITIKIPVEIDGRVLFELMKKFDMEQYRRTGRPSFQM